MKTVVKRRPFGRTGLTVSEVGLGAMNLRRLETRAQAEEMINFTLDQGINVIDTARAYNGVNGSGETIESEQIVGSVIASRKDIDEPIVIITKGHAYTKADLDADLNTSLSKLGVRKQDGGLFIGQTRIYLVYLLHGIKDDRWASVLADGVIDHAIKRRDAGDFNFLGFSSHYGDYEVIKAALDTGKFQAAELPYNVYNRSLGEDSAVDLIKYAHDMGVGIINMKAFNGNGMVSIAKIIQDECSISYSDMLRFCLSNPCVSTIDAGARYPAELAADIEASLLPPMDEKERSGLKAITDGVAPLLNSICRECMHCLEKFSCPQGLDFPGILALQARYSLAVAMGKDTVSIKEQYAALSGPSAAECAECGACVPWCEYHLDIPAIMKKSHAVITG